ncbi:hypothetical protein HYH03_017767 [Edaphochlamys debaryana]|uniref:Uncharacterized protein n=1 Tax=Edaphochlamys debaryana TaxID=47281 RepID=A0A835XIF8_9CHLO|nr:hypothetical protein HYH03_017767 [Edaphochlamys debaryana]|eukprot:KAG2483368.1 hypothetical protein HYH03_017767 [Edaphochlamys debaryana]
MRHRMFCAGPHRLTAFASRDGRWEKVAQVSARSFMTYLWDPCKELQPQLTGLTETIINNRVKEMEAKHGAPAAGPADAAAAAGGAYAGGRHGDGAAAAGNAGRGGRGGRGGRAVRGGDGAAVAGGAGGTASDGAAESEKDEEDQPQPNTRLPQPNTRLPQANTLAAREGEGDGEEEAPLPKRPSRPSRRALAAAEAVAAVEEAMDGVGWCTH